MRRWESSLLILSALLWVPSIGGPSFLSDDFDHLVTWGLPPVTDIWQWFYTESFGYFRPLTALLWNIEHALWELNPSGYQYVNLVMHILCALLTRDITNHIFTGRGGFYAGLFFLFMPGHIFGVLMIAALTGLLCSLFYLASIALYLRGRKNNPGLLLLSTLSFLCALLSKELALSLPLVIGTWELLLLRASGQWSLVRWLRSCWPYGLALLLYLGFRYALFEQMPSSPLHSHFSILRILVNSATYTAKIFAPWGLEGLKPFFREYPELLISCAIVGFSLAFGLIAKKFRTLKIGHVQSISWMALTMLPVISLYSPWNSYLPSAGSAMLVGILIDRLLDRPTPARRFVIVFFLGLCVVYSLQHQRQWLNARILCEQIVKACEDKATSVPIYIVNLPAEWDDVPLFIGDWALQYALQMKKLPVKVQSLALVHQNTRAQQISVTQTDSCNISLTLNGVGEFFRLETEEMMAKTRKPTIGYQYSKGAITIEVQGLNDQGEANRLNIDLADKTISQHVFIWDDNRLKKVMME